VLHLKEKGATIPKVQRENNSFAQREEGYHISYFLLLNSSGVSNKAPRPPLQLGSSPFHTFGTGIQLRGIKLMVPFIIILESAEGWD
jgi:hypothetical protein